MNTGTITRRPEGVRILVPLLDDRQLPIVTLSLPGSDQKRDIFTADESMQALVELTGHDEGYKRDDPTDKRFAAIDRWKAWWQAEGKTAFLKKHPEVAALSKHGT